MKALVTGADGFVGRWLVRHLEDAGDEIIPVAGPRQGISGLDVRDLDKVMRAFDEAQPDVVYHLAAVAYGPDADAAPGEATAINVGGTVNVLEACRALTRPPFVLVASSSEVYGRPRSGNPLRESDPVAPTNIYGGTKAAQEMMALAYHRASLVPVIVMRAFNHIGPGQRESFVISGLAAQLADIAAGAKSPVLQTGNLDVARDFTDVRDVVRAYRLAVEAGAVGSPLNVARGEAIKIGVIVDMLVALADVAVTRQAHPGRIRRNDPPVMTGDPTELRNLTGWYPLIPLQQSLTEIWEAALASRGLTSGGWTDSALRSR